MIISHKYRFIFLRTTKVGGTSLEIALSKYLGPDDIITHLKPREERFRREQGFPGARNFAKPLRRWTAREYAYSIKQTMRRKWRRLPLQFMPHMSAGEVKARVPDEVWENYYRFSIDRNPWDQTVSRYYWWIQSDPRKNRQASFAEYVRNGYNHKISNFNIYSINGVPAVHRIVRYENLESDLAEVSARIGYPENIYDIMKRISSKSGYRGDKTDYREMYDSELRGLVGLQYAREIALHGYQF